MAFHRGHGCAALLALVCALGPRAAAEAADAPTIAVEIYVFGPARPDAREIPFRKLPLSLPAPEAGGRIAFRGGLPTRTFSAPSYVVRFGARQGEASASREVPLRLADEVPQAPLRIGSRP